MVCSLSSNFILFIPAPLSLSNADKKWEALWPPLHFSAVLHSWTFLLVLTSSSLFLLPSICLHTTTSLDLAEVILDILVVNTNNGHNKICFWSHFLGSWRRLFQNKGVPVLWKCQESPASSLCHTLIFTPDICRFCSLPPWLYISNDLSTLALLILLMVLLPPTSFFPPRPHFPSGDPHTLVCTYKFYFSFLNPYTFFTQPTNPSPLWQLCPSVDEWIKKKSVVHLNNRINITCP